jgi:hypothetical protein
MMAHHGTQTLILIQVKLLPHLSLRELNRLHWRHQELLQEVQIFLSSKIELQTRIWVACRDSKEGVDPSIKVACKDLKEVPNLSSKAITTIENNLSLNQNGIVVMTI